MLKSSPQNRIDRNEALDRFQHAPLLSLGRMAFDAKRRRFGDAVTYVNNRQINPTNLCVFTCSFCSFAARPKDAHQYSLTEEEIIAYLDEEGLHEVHIVGGLWPKWGFQRSRDLVATIRELRPDLWIKAFTAVEVDFFAKTERRSVEAILTELRDAGIDGLTGGGAEVLSNRVHQELYPQKTSPQDWLAIHEQAHRMDIHTNSTLLFGHIETDEEIIDHLFALRDLEDRAPGFTSFIPLAYQPGDTELVDRLVSAPRCLRVIAIARLVLDNIPHIKAYWPTLQIETAIAALSFGADDMDGTLGQERIMQLACSGTPAEVSREFMEGIIREGGQVPVQRHGNYDPVSETNLDDRTALSSTGT